MARKHTDGGVAIAWDAESERTLKRLERIDARLFRRARGRAAYSAERALFSTIKRHGNPKYGVAKLAKRQPVTVAANGGRPSDVFGKFASDSRYTVAYLRGDVQVIGWADRLHGFMSALQSAESRDLSVYERKHLAAAARENGRGVTLPASYSRPERDVIGPFADNMATTYPGWIVSNFEKMAEQRMARSGR